jgi:phosphoribosylglycinamide formyltransferase 1
MIKQKLALFASGRGSNALNIIDYFKNNANVEISFVLTNNKNAGIIDSAGKLCVKVFVCTNQEVENSTFLIDICEKNEISFVVLAGFLRKIPEEFVNHFPNKIINIHPALLPKYGGEGMYGANVHRAVLENKEKETGITIHFVNSEYDKGEIIAQFSCELSENESIETIQEKIHALEMENFPRVIEKVLKDSVF